MDKRAIKHLQLDVDAMALDFLVDRAIKSLVAEEMHVEDSDRALAMVDDRKTDRPSGMVHIFKNNHSDPTGFDDLQYRLSLLQFAALFRHRNNAAHETAPTPLQLGLLRSSNATRAAGWLHQHNDTAAATVLDGRTLPARPAVSLLDLTPRFVDLTAQRLQGRTSPKWLHLAAEFMLQAVLEFGVRDRAQRARIVDEAFAWGFVARLEDDLDYSPFRDDDRESDSGCWTEIRRDYRHDALTEDARELQAQYPVASFDRLVMRYVQTLAASLEPPILLQLKAGQIRGLTQEETRILRLRCNLADD